MPSWHTHMHAQNSPAKNLMLISQVQRIEMTLQLNMFEQIIFFITQIRCWIITCVNMLLLSHCILTNSDKLFFEKFNNKKIQQRKSKIRRKKTQSPGAANVSSLPTRKHFYYLVSYPEAFLHDENLGSTSTSPCSRNACETRWEPIDKWFTFGGARAPRSIVFLNQHWYLSFSLELICCCLYFSLINSNKVILNYFTWEMQFTRWWYNCNNRYWYVRTFMTTWLGTCELTVTYTITERHLLGSAVVERYRNVCLETIEKCSRCVWAKRIKLLGAHVDWQRELQK